MCSLEIRLGARRPCGRTPNGPSPGAADLDLEGKRGTNMGVLLARQGPAAVVTMSWPEQRNALGPDEARQVSDALRQAAETPDVAGVVLTGEGAFCAGGNLKIGRASCRERV